MKYYSTNKKALAVDFGAALLSGLASDGGLYMPNAWPKSAKQVQSSMPTGRQAKFKVPNFGDILKNFVDIPEKNLKSICDDAFNFPAPLVKLDKNLYILELFHGPTFSFKDFGARFMARAMNYYATRSAKRKARSVKLNIVVATSGDTGGAVASAFYGLPNVKVFVLYPSKRISGLQEKQIATLGKNIIALEVGGDFDDCQRLAKRALADENLRSKINLSSANSINIGRLLPQMYYYFLGYQQYCDSRIAKRKVFNDSRLALSDSPVFVVPSGNFGNLTAGLFAKKIGLPIKKFIAAVNTNSAIPDYLKTGKMGFGKTQMNASSAMDVKNPSNWARVTDLYRDQSRTNADLRGKIKKDLGVIAVSETETTKTIKEIYKKYNYICDPHTAVGVAAALKSKTTGLKIVLATAHPAKFKEIAEDAISKKISLPRELAEVSKKSNKSIVISKNYKDFYNFLVASR